MTGVSDALKNPFGSEVRFELAGADLERLVVVAGDLEYLIELPNDRLLTHTEVRFAAGILRRLLLDGQLNAIWKPIGQATRTRPTVETSEIDTTISQIPNQWIHYALAGGANTKAANHSGLLSINVPAAERGSDLVRQMEVSSLEFAPQWRRMSVDDWLKSTSIAMQTTEAGLVTISRRAVLKYIANRKGGVHFDPRRGLDLTSAKKRKESIEYLLLDLGVLRIGHLSGPEFEVASMAQAIATSDWANQLIEAARSGAPEDFEGDPMELKIWTGLREADGTGWATFRMQPESGLQQAGGLAPPSLPVGQADAGGAGGRRVTATRRGVTRLSLAISAGQAPWSNRVTPPIARVREFEARRTMQA